MNQPHVYIYPSSLPPSFHPLGRHRAQSWAPCDIQQIPNGYFTRGSARVKPSLSVHSFPIHPPSNTLPSTCSHIHSQHLGLYYCPTKTFSPVSFWSHPEIVSFQLSKFSVLKVSVFFFFFFSLYISNESPYIFTY